MGLPLNPYIQGKVLAYVHIFVCVLFVLCTLGWHVMCVNALILFRWAASPKRDACREASRLAAEIHKQNL